MIEAYPLHWPLGIGRLLEALQQAQNSVIAEVERVVGERAQTADQE